MTLRAVIFDHSTVLVDEHNRELLAQLRRLLEKLKALGLKIVVFSTNPKDINSGLSRRRLPTADLVLTMQQVNERKGTRAWVQMAAGKLGIETFQLMYVGDDRRDWREAINSATFYLHAGWVGDLPHGVTAYAVDEPAEVLMPVTHFLLLPPRWEYILDYKDRRLCVRSLLGALTELPATNAKGSFQLQDVFTRNINVPVGQESARNLLMLHVLSSAYLEGLILPNSLFAVYPSHTPGQTNDRLRGFLEPAARLFKSYFREDLLVRAVQGKDTSLERVQARKQERQADVSFTHQANTVHVNPRHERIISKGDKTVLVFDDFTTSGMTLEWARNLLYSAGARRVVLLTVGKYPPWTYSLFTPVEAGIVTPFEHKIYDDFFDFERMSLSMNRDAAAPGLVRTSFEYYARGQEFPSKAA